MECALNATEDLYNCTYRLDGVDGVRRTVISSGLGFLDEDGKLVQFVGVLSDVTEVARQRSLAEDRALFAEQMVGIVSHDLRNPLSAILMGAKLLAHGEVAPGKLRVLGHITSSAERAKRLIADLLDFTLARVGRGLVVTRETFDLHALVASIVEELALSFPDRTIVHLKNGAGMCSADADRVAQLLGNLVGNAMAYGTPGSAVTVTSEVPSKGTGATARLSVHNMGEPVPPEMLESVFEPMVRGEPGDSGSRSVGLGLFIVRAIAVAHGGDVSVDSSRERGTTFTFTFPCA